MAIAPNTIFKFTLGLTDRQFIAMPKGARVLTAQMQRNAIVIWAEVHSDSVREVRTFWIVGTGNPLPTMLVRYVASVQDGEFVWHVYEEATA